MQTDAPKVTISIAMMQSGRVTVQGPLGDKILCLGLLELAKEIVKAHKVEQNMIQVPSIAVDPTKIGKGN